MLKFVGFIFFSIVKRLYLSAWKLADFGKGVSAKQQMRMTTSNNLKAVEKTQFSGQTNKVKRAIGKGLKIILTLVVYAHVALMGIILLYSITYINWNPRRTSLMLYRADYNFSSIKEASYIPLRKVSKTFLLDLINLEDGRFREHFGFDIEAIRHARELNKKAGYRAYGGSTITQQLARTLFLIPHKNYFRKYLELIIALELELILGKDRILELYINYAELGKGVYGFNDAAVHYYKKPFLKTTDDQKIRLLTILASPLRYSPTTFKKNKRLADRYQFIYRYHRLH